MFFYCRMATDSDDCYHLRMQKLALDCNAVLARIEEYVLVQIPRPRVTEPQLWPWGRREEVRMICWEHIMGHGIPAQIQRDGVWVDDYRCPDWPCPMAGISFAHFEIMTYLESLKMTELLQVIERCETFATMPENLKHPRRDEVLALAAYYRDRLMSAQLKVAWTGGRPKTPLAQAVALHLRVGGFKLAEIGQFMGTTTEACRKRCKTVDWRAVVPYVPDVYRGEPLELA